MKMQTRDKLSIRREDLWECIEQGSLDELKVVEYGPWMATEYISETRKIVFEYFGEYFAYMQTRFYTWPLRQYEYPALFDAAPEIIELTPVKPVEVTKREWKYD